MDHFTPQHTTGSMLIRLFRVTSWFDTVCNIVTRWVNFRENHLHEHKLQYSDYDIKKYFDPNIMYFWYYLKFFVLTLKRSKAKIVNIYFSIRNLYILGENTSKYSDGLVFKKLPWDLASVNAMKQTCVIVILEYFTWFQHKPRCKRRLNIKYRQASHFIYFPQLV